tara:strand:- start:684 stop:983 length:300 start_codon:yes stop_codon:yes gene_type:complete
MRYFKIIFPFIIFILLNNCQGFKDALEGKNQKTTDEFLVKKKDPLILPPDYDKLPVPRTKQSREKGSLESVFKSSKDLDVNSESISELESAILKELKKN